MSIRDVDTLQAFLSDEVEREYPVPWETLIVEDPAEEFAATPFEIKPEQTLYQRDWLLGQRFIRGRVVVISAAGGVGKTLYTLATMVSIASARNYLAGTIAPEIAPYRVWYLNLEDPLPDLQLLVQAFCKHYGVTQEQLADRLFLDSGMDRPVVVAEETKDGLAFLPVLDALIAQIKVLGIDLLVLDPYVSAHRVNENSNPLMDQVAKQFSKIAHDLNICIVLVHHVRKANGQQATADHVRGGNALVNAARSVEVLNSMTQSEAGKYNIDDPRDYFSVTIDKANLARTGGKTWYRKVPVTMNNRVNGQPGDEIAVVERWFPPSAFDDVTVGDLDEVRARVRAQPDYWMKAPQGKDKWFGALIARVLGLDLEDQSDRRKVNTIIKTWIENDEFETYKARAGNRQQVQFVRVRVAKNAADFARVRVDQK